MALSTWPVAPDTRVAATARRLLAPSWRSLSRSRCGRATADGEDVAEGASAKSNYRQHRHVSTLRSVCLKAPGYTYSQSEQAVGSDAICKQDLECQNNDGEEGSGNDGDGDDSEVDCSVWHGGRYIVQLWLGAAEDDRNLSQDMVQESQVHTQWGSMFLLPSSEHQLPGLTLAFQGGSRNRPQRTQIALHTVRVPSGGSSSARSQVPTLFDSLSQKPFITHAARLTRPAP
jgi:hypothetical protein